MAVIYRYPLTTTFGAGTDAAGSFDAVRSMQANGTNPTGTASPTGNGSQISIVDGWARMLMNETDAPFAGNIRSELTGPDEAVPSTRFYRWESRCEGWPVTSDRYVVMQMHANHDGDIFAENVLIQCNGESLSLFLPLVEPPGTNPVSRLMAELPIQMGAIYKQALFVRWDKTGDGELAWIVNGRVIFNATRIGTEYNYTVGPYLKLGVYTNGGKPAGWVSRVQFIRNVIVTDGLDGKSWTELIGDIPRPQSRVVL